MLTLFIVSTLDDWYEIMSIAVNSDLPEYVIKKKSEKKMTLNNNKINKIDNPFLFFNPRAPAVTTTNTHPTYSSSASFYSQQCF